MNSLKVIEDIKEFDNMILLIKTNFPKCKKWLDWYLHSDRAKLLFPAKKNYSFVGGEYPNTNAEESMGNVVQLSCEQKQPTISQLYLHLFMLASKHDAEYVAACQGYETQYPTRKKKRNRSNDGRAPDSCKLLFNKTLKSSGKQPGRPKGSKNLVPLGKQSTLIKQ